MKLLTVFLFLMVSALAQANEAGGSLPALPGFDPGAEVATWNGRSWNISDNRIFQARFERYLSTPLDINQDTTEHFKILSRIRELLAPSKISLQSREEAFRLLEEASEYQADDMLSDAISNQVYSAWLAQKDATLLQSATATLEAERKRLEWNLKIVAGTEGLGAPVAGHVPGQPQIPPNSRRSLEMQQITARLAEVNILLKSNLLKKEVSQAQAKTDFQILIVQLFLQRRFQHVLIATRFYRSIFTDGTSQQIKFGEEAQNLFTKATGHAPTLTSLDSLCGELISNAHDGVSAFKALLAEREMASATKRLSEAFVIGEYLTPLDVVPISKKRQALVFIQKSNQLLSALDVKDYTLAEKLVNDLEEIAKDFDVTKASAAIQTAKTASAFHLAKARNAASSGDKAALEVELEAAAAIWPTNPALAEVAAGIYSQGNVNARALVDFERLVSQRSWRQIYNERMRFIPAVANEPEKQAKLQEVIDNVIMIDRTIARAQELEKRGDSAGAWEITEVVYRQFPEAYPRLNKAHEQLMLQAADYVEAVSTAERLEAAGEQGSSLSWFLQAQAIYPSGELAKAGMQRLGHLILPDSW